MTGHGSVLVVGAGLAGCTAAALLRDRYRVTVYECGHVGGLCRDDGGLQLGGPHAFHTDDEEVWAFVNRYAEFRPFAHSVSVLTEPWHFRDLPIRPGDDPAFRIYSEKAWGIPWEELPDSIRTRVPTVCTDGRAGYLGGNYLGQPAGGYSAMCRRMLDGCEVVVDGDRQAWRRAMHGVRHLVWCGDINDYSGGGLPWIGRRWVHVDGVDLAGATAVNYATHAIPALRAWHHGRINPYHCGHGVGFEFCGDTPCYPHPAQEHVARAAAIVAEASARGHILCGRMATYRYLDMDQTVRNVIDSIKDAGL